MRSTSDTRVEFLGKGYIDIKLVDAKAQEALLFICMPYCLMQTFTPSLLGCGFIDELRLFEPVHIWTPKISNSRLHPALVDHVGLTDAVNHTISEETLRIAHTFASLAPYLIDPTDIMTILPLGTYITFDYRCKYSKQLELISNIESINVAGRIEFQDGLAKSLAKCCSLTNDVINDGAIEYLP